MAIAGVLGMIVAFIVRSFDDDVDDDVPAAEVARIENASRLAAANQG